jgi:hypothetical protein
MKHLSDKNSALLSFFRSAGDQLLCNQPLTLRSITVTFRKETSGQRFSFKLAQEIQVSRCCVKIFQIVKLHFWWRCFTLKQVSVDLGKSP